MADSISDNGNKKQDNPYKRSVNKWVIWTAIAVIIFVILLLVFNRRSTVVNPEAESDSPIALTTFSFPDKNYVAMREIKDCRRYF